MNTEERLQRASEEIERVTASLTAPPIGGVRRSARLRTIGVAVGAALGAIVLIGGVVLAFGSDGEAILAPASPTDATAPIFVDGIRVVIPELDPAPQFDLGDESHELEFQVLGEGVADDIRAMTGGGGADEWLERIDEATFVGATGEYRAYEFVGMRGPETPGSETWSGSCLVIYAPSGASGASCGDLEDRGSLDTMVNVSAFSNEAGEATFIVAGRAPDGSSVVMLEIDGRRTWRRTRDGYGFLAGDGPTDSHVRYIVYDVHGNVLAGTTFNAGDDKREEATAVTIGPAVEADGSCSGGRFFPSSDPEMDLREPVFQTRSKILLFASRCWFDELADLAGENFTASFGGSDPAELWASQEENGDEPMHALLRILGMPYGTVDTGSGPMYIWPAAAAHDGEWDTIPEADKEALRTLYDEEDFAAFEEFGYYGGYRLGITEDGDWSFFVAGD